MLCPKFTSVGNVLHVFLLSCQLQDQLRLERSRLSDFELEEREHMRMKRQREKRALEEDVDIEVGGGKEEREGRREVLYSSYRAVCSMPSTKC